MPLPADTIFPADTAFWERFNVIFIASRLTFLEYIISGLTGPVMRARVLVISKTPRLDSSE